jgi:polar amino acid transport system substrate-binding protein
MKFAKKVNIKMNCISIQSVLLILIIVAMMEFISVSIIIIHLFKKLNINTNDESVKIFMLKIIAINSSMILLFILIVLLVTKVFKKINNYAFYSCTTGLPNKNYILNNLIDKISNDTEFTALISLDMDDFKAVNDTLGHLAGDELLKQAGERFEQIINEQDCVCHIGGDEFLFFIKSAINKSEVEQLAKKIQEIFAKPFFINGSNVDYVTGSLGIALMSTDANDFKTLYNCSDNAMYMAKKLGKGGYKFYDKNISLHLYEESVKKMEIKEVIKKKEFKMFYQPNIF